jgi:hypothetical protein
VSLEAASLTSIYAAAAKTALPLLVTALPPTGVIMEDNLPLRVSRARPYNPQNLKLRLISLLFPCRALYLQYFTPAIAN